MSESEIKEKPKKKKSAPKEKNEEGLTAPEGERKASLTPERKPSEKESKSRKQSAAEGADPESRTRKQSSAEGVEKEPKSRKSSSATDEKPSKSRKSSAAAVKPEPVEEPQEEDEEDDGEMPLMPEPDRQWDPNHIPFQAIAEAEKNIDVNAPVAYFQAPPESTKTDIHLLKDLDTRKLAELMEAFTMFDFDQDGVINEHDLKHTFGSLGQPDVDQELLSQMLSEGLNPLDFDAFVVLMGYKTLELDPEEILTEALAQWDYGTEGLISEERIQHDLMSFGDRFTKEEALAALEDAPVVLNNKTRMIDYMRFSNDLCGLRKRMSEQKKLK